MAILPIRAKKTAITEGRKSARLSPHNNVKALKAKVAKAAKMKKGFTPRPVGQHRYAVRSLQKVFPFFKLPAELREKILIYALVIEDDIKIVQGPVKPSSPARREYISFSLQNPFSKTFLLSRQFYDEALPIAYGMNSFHFDDLLTFVHFFFDKLSCAKFVKTICFEIDQASIVKPMNGFLDVWTLLKPNQCNAMLKNYDTLLRLTMRKLPKVQQLAVKVITLFNSQLSTRKYYSAVFALLFLQQTEWKDKDRVTLGFTVRNPNYKSSPKTRLAPTKNLSREMRTSLVGTALATMYLLHLREHYSRRHTR